MTDFKQTHKPTTLSILSTCLATVLLACLTIPAIGSAGCSKSEERVSVSQVARGSQRIGSFSFGSDGEVKFRPSSDGDLELSYKDLPSVFPEEFPLYPGAKLVVASSNRSQQGEVVCAAAWDTDDPTEKVISYYKEALAKPPWSLRQAQVNEEGNSGWVSFSAPQVTMGQLGVGPTGGPYTIALLLTIAADVRGD